MTVAFPNRRCLAVLLLVGVTACGTDPHDRPPDAPGSGAPDEAAADARPDRAEAAEDLGRNGPPSPLRFVATVSATTQVIPAENLPPELDLGPANNNLDLVRHADGALYLAFRTAPDHFASAQARLYVLRSEDEQTWSFEATFARGTDLREPRLLSWDGRLLLYFAVLGSNRTAFEPQGMMVAARRGPGDWSAPEWSYVPGFIPWRARVVGGAALLIGYDGGDAIYGTETADLRVHWLTTDDDLSWAPYLPDQPVVLRGGGSETDYAFLDDGGLVAVVRNEAGDESGFGSRICHAPPENLGDWRCTTDPRKYDSPAVFSHRGGVFLVGRRNLTETGHYDLGRDDLPLEEQRITYELDYWFHPKRCAVWQVFPEGRSVSFLADLPSRGDTCFPAVVPLGGDDFLVYNYSSPVDGPELTWLEGQNGPTNIYRSVVTLTPDTGGL